jgi:hypothetical protein
MRFAILLHRYLGIALGLVVALWCLSGFVMMYVQYPELTEKERVAGLEPLDFSGCCDGSASELSFANLVVDRFQVEMLAGRPVLRLFAWPEEQVVDLRRGSLLPELTPSAGEAVSAAFARQIGVETRGAEIRPLWSDQWTVSGEFEPHRPLYRFRAGDAAGTEWYVSSRTGEVVQLTTRPERLWNWVGSVTHWIYFTALRQEGAAWARTVIWLSVVSLFLAVLGIYIGVKQLGRRRNGRPSPYRGWALWHHYAGLVFGVFTLTWLASGLLSMNPWGALESRSFGAERERLRGGEITGVEVEGMLHALAGHSLPEGTVRLDSSLVEGRFALIAWSGEGARMRLDAETLEPHPLGADVFSNAADVLRPDVPVAEQAWLAEEDAYYFAHHGAPELPVYKIRYGDGELFYLDRVSGEPALVADVARQRYRWFFEALHRGDFARIVRLRPLWDLFMLTLLLGVTVSALTGVWLGGRRVARAFRRRRRPNEREAPAASG